MTWLHENMDSPQPPTMMAMNEIFNCYSEIIDVLKQTKSKLKTIYEEHLENTY